MSLRGNRGTARTRSDVGSRLLHRGRSDNRSQWRPGIEMDEDRRSRVTAPLSGSSSAPASLLDLTGRRVGRLKLGTNDVHQLRTGVYFIKPGDGTAARKVIIQN